VSLNLDVLIETGEEFSVDMKSGLTTLQGCSNAILCISDTVLSEGVVPKKRASNGKVRTRLKKNFKGSYIQSFSLDIHDSLYLKKFRSIGKEAFCELISYFIADSLYKDFDLKNVKAQQILEKLGDSAEELSKQLRVSSIGNIHETATQYNNDVQLRYRKNGHERIIIGKFNRESSGALSAFETDEKEKLEVCITRLNIYTGNGRLQIKGKTETIPFGFTSLYRDVKIEAKKLFSKNLDHNNGISVDKYKYLDVTAKPVKLKDGTTVKYIIIGFYN
jgi:hypothetical protein